VSRARTEPGTSRSQVQHILIAHHVGQCHQNTCTGGDRLMTLNRTVLITWSGILNAGFSQQLITDLISSVNSSFANNITTAI